MGMIAKRPKLTRAQEELFSIMCSALEKDVPLMFEEVKKIYIEHSCRNVVNGEPLREDYKYVDGECKFYMEPMPEWYLNSCVMQFLSMNIGALVLKGHLRVVPAFDWNDKKLNPSQGIG